MQMFFIGITTLLLEGLVLGFLGCIFELLFCGRLSLLSDVYIGLLFRRRKASE